MRALALVVVLAACEARQPFERDALCGIVADIAKEMEGDLEVIQKAPNFVVPPDAAISDDPDRAWCERLLFVGAQARGMYRVSYGLAAKNREHYAPLDKAIQELDQLGYTFSTVTASVERCLQRTPAALTAELRDRANAAHTAIIQACFR